jgi:hypothetical protein
MKKSFSNSEKEILNLMHIPSEQLSDLVGYPVQYASNYFVVNDNIATIRFISKGESGYIVPHSLGLGKRPKGAIFYINKNDYNVTKTQKESSDKKKDRPKLGKPAGWNKIDKLNDYKLFFHRGHLIAYTLGGGSEIQGDDCKSLKSLFIQTAWSNMGKDVKDEEKVNKFSQWHFEEKVVNELKKSSVCIASCPIYRNNADVIPIGVHLQAVTKEKSLFNVFLPNIDSNIVINYKKCTFKPKK